MEIRQQVGARGRVGAGDRGLSRTLGTNEALKPPTATTFSGTAPTAPGIYLMRNATGALLYVGKAKNLRKRLNSYRSLTRASRKTRRLLHIVHAIAWEICESDTAAQVFALQSGRPSEEPWLVGDTAILNVTAPSGGGVEASGAGLA